MVDHLLLYHPAVNRLKMLIEEGVLGELVYAQSDRLNVNYHKMIEALCGIWHRMMFQ